MEVKIGILGAGATGSNIGGHLKKGGAEVWFVDLNKEWMDGVREKGLTWVDAATGVEYPPFFVDGAVTSASECGICDVVIVMTKCADTVAALRGSAAMIGDKTEVITLQNGLGNVENVEQVIPRERIGYGITITSGTILGPGKAIASVMPDDNVIFTRLMGEKNEMYSLLEEYMNKGGMPSHYVEDIGYLFWMKAGANCVLNMPCGITHLNLYDFIAVPETKKLIYGIIDEVIAVAHAEGCESVTVEDLRDRVYSGLKNPPAKKHYPSGAQDIMGKRKTEVEYLNGAVSRLGEKHGIPTPYNTTVAEIAKILQSTYHLQDVQ